MTKFVDNLSQSINFPVVKVPVGNWMCFIRSKLCSYTV